MGIAFQRHYLYSQFSTLPYPTHSFKGQTIIVTGANTGLGYDAALHFVRLGAAKVILGCRSREKGERAAASIARETGVDGAAEFWALDLADYDSVRAFARRGAQLPRIDAVVENAGVSTSEWVPCGGSDVTVAVNVYSTFLLLGLLLPKLERDATQFGHMPVVTVVTSITHHFVPFEAEGSRDDIFGWLDDAASFENMARYWMVKLLQVHAVRALAQRMDRRTTQSSEGGPGVVVNLVNPGLCRTAFGDDMTGVGAFIFHTLKSLIGRTSEVGSRNLVAAVTVGPEGHGRYITDCEINDRGISRAVRSDRGHEMQEKIWEQLKARLQKIELGIFKHC